MKHLILGLWYALLTIGTTYSQAFNFSVSNSTYSSLASSTSCNNGLTWDDPNFTIPLGFNFHYFGQTIDTVKITFGYGGTLLTSLNSNGIASFLSPYGADLMDRGFNFTSGSGQSGSLSNISYLTSGNIGNRVCKIEWNNAGFYGDIQQNGNQASDFVNFQLWLFEGTNDIEIHFGPNSVSNAQVSYDGLPGPDILLIPNMNLNNFNFGSNYYCVNGMPLSPSFNTLTPSDTIRYINGTIPNGTVYSFSPITTQLNEEPKGKIIIYPQPASETLFLKDLEVDEYWVRDLQGKIYRRETIRTDKINLSGLANGIYLFEFKKNDESFIQKVIIDR